MSIAAIVNVRMESTRLPGKVLRNICGKPLLHHLLGRLAMARAVKSVVVATSTRLSNDAIAAFCAKEGFACFRGSEEDVLARTLGALQSVGAETGVVVFGDGPLIDPAIVDRVVDVYVGSKSAHDFVGNDLKTTFPPGMEVEVFSLAALADADRRCIEPAIREHGTLYLRRNPQLYRLLNVDAPPSLRRPDLELEVDTEADLRVIASILDHFPGRSDFDLSEIISLLDAHPEIAAINQTVPRRWKEFRSDC